jgi:hypothetical protein
MYLYRVFGGVLRSPVEFPELPAATGEPSWTIEIGDVASPVAPDALIGDDTVYGEVRVHCFRTAAGHALIYDDTGRFDIEDDGALIRWYQPEDLTPQRLDAARADVIGRVLALALHQQGVLTLHASAIAIGSQGIALLAPKGHGKSTLAAALVKQGGRLLSDDTLPVSQGARLTLRPGVPQLRLWRDAAMQLVAERADEATAGRKVVLDRLDPETVATEGVPFVAAYIVVPAVPREDQPAVTRLPLAQIQATLGLIEHTKLGPLLGGEDARRVFEQAATIAQEVPLYLLKVARDLNRIEEVARTIAGWHGSDVV